MDSSIAVLMKNLDEWKKEAEEVIEIQRENSVSRVHGQPFDNLHVLQAQRICLLVLQIETFIGVGSKDEESET